MTTTDQTPKPDFSEADRWAASTHEGIDRTDWLHAQAYLALRAESEELRAEIENQKEASHTGDLSAKERVKALEDLIVNWKQEPRYRTRYYLFALEATAADILAARRQKDGK